MSMPMNSISDLISDLKSRRWYEFKNILPSELLKEALSEDVLKTLFPKSLSLKYNYVKKLLYQ